MTHNTSKGYVLIHIGKCSGTLLYNFLNKNDFKPKIIHHANYYKSYENNYLEIDFEEFKDKNIIVCMRHPISRLISAFNFKYTCRILQNRRSLPIYSNGNQKNVDDEIKGFEYFENIQKLGETLYDESGIMNEKARKFCLSCDHIDYGFHHYLKNMTNYNNIIVLRHEYLKDDCENNFGLVPDFPKNNLQPNYKSEIYSKIRTSNKILSVFYLCLRVLK